MNILLFLVPLSLLLLVAAIGAFVWAVRRGQFDDLDTAALDILVDDEPQPHTTTPSPQAADPASGPAPDDAA